MFYSSAPVQEGVYIYINILIYSGLFGYIADWGYPFVSLLPIHGITDHNGPTVPVSCSMALAMQGLCSGDFCGMSGINWVQGQTEGGDPRCYEAEEPRSALAKDQLGPCFNGKMLQDWGTSSTNGGFSRARFRTDWHIPASRCSEVAPALTAFQACQLRPTHELLVSSCLGVLYIYIYSIWNWRKHGIPPRLQNSCCWTDSLLAVCVGYILNRLSRQTQIGHNIILLGSIKGY